MRSLPSAVSSPFVVRACLCVPPLAPKRSSAKAPSQVLPQPARTVRPPTVVRPEKQAMAPQVVVFSDIDGTIMHDPTDEDLGEDRLVTPPSTSGRQGTISAKTIQQVAALRKEGARFVIITGARLSTLLMRLPYLPAADAFVCENGGRIFYPGSSLPTACPLTEDTEWRGLQAAAGPPQQDSVAPERRQGLLWDWYRRAHEENWPLDANGYTTSFRIHAKKGKTLDQLHKLIEGTPTGLASSFNLGSADFYPATSGKCSAARYLMSRYASEAQHCAFLCDDDNDMELAAIIGKAFLPNVSSDSVARAVEARPDHFVRATKQGPAATEEMLDAVKGWIKTLAPATVTV